MLLLMEACDRKPVFQFSPASRERMADALRTCLESHPEVGFAYLFGSASGDGPYRDVDVGVFISALGAGLGEANAAATVELQLANELGPVVREITGVPIPVDVRVINQAPIAFQYHVLRSVELMVRDRVAHALFFERVVTLYLDMKPLREQAIREILRR